VYQEIGFDEVGFVPDLFKDGVAEHVMVKVRKD
jgi:hypothetical protein